jgi:hypothetical protein
MSQAKDGTRDTNRPATPRHPYTKPELVEYGSVAKLTQGSLTVGNDGPLGGFKNMMCL